MNGVNVNYIPPKNNFTNFPNCKEIFVVMQYNIITGNLVMEEQQMTKEKENKLTPVSIRLEEEVITHLKRVARYESFEQDEDISYVDLIRQAILNTYPMPNNANA